MLGMYCYDSTGPDRRGRPSLHKQAQAYRANGATLLLFELDPAARFSEVHVDFTSFLSDVSKVEAKPVGGRAELSGLHGRSHQVLLVVVLGINRGVLADDQRPVFFRRNDVQGVAAGRDRGPAQGEVGFGEERHRRAARSQNLTQGQSVALAGWNRIIARGDLLAILEGADGSLRLRGRLLPSGRGDQGQDTR